MRLLINETLVRTLNDDLSRENKNLLQIQWYTTASMCFTTEVHNRQLCALKVPQSLYESVAQSEQN